jgi:hypothetical protein
MESGDAENDTPIFYPLISTDNSNSETYAYIDNIGSDVSVILTVLKTLPIMAGE